MTDPTSRHHRPDTPRIASADFSLLIIGDEILSGKRADKHMPKLIELLAARGLRLDAAEYVGDSPVHITACLRRALAHASATGGAVFSCGGIGATPDDHTRQCAAAALGAPLALHPQAAALIHERMKDVAAAQGTPYEPDKPDNLHRLNMALFPQGATIIPNPYNKIAGFSLAATGGQGGVFFFPGFPVMAWPMMAWVLDTHCPHLFHSHAQLEKSVIVFGAMEATLTPLMEQIECDFPGAKVFSLPSVDHPQYGRHIELGVKGPLELTANAYAALLQGLRTLNTPLGPELVR
ncbi:MAG: competence/damage-inducible protein A [Burkholderiales bacterium]